MHIILYPFLFFSGFGLALSVAAHLVALAGIALPGIGFVWALHIGIFVVWIPSVLIGILTTRQTKRKDYWRVVLMGCPVWMRRAVYVFIGYGILNFFLLMQVTGVSQQPSDATSLTVIRGFSGHWMVFYSAAFAMLYSAIHAPQLFQERKCPKGHVVAPSANCCSECGYAFPSETQKR